MVWRGMDAESCPNDGTKMHNVNLKKSLRACLRASSHILISLKIIEYILFFTKKSFFICICAIFVVILYPI